MLKENKMKKIVLIFLSGLLMLTSLWGGAYFLSQYPFGSWQNFPIFFTAFWCGIGGAWLLIYAIHHCK